MDRLTDSNWWWDVAFDGLASSLLAAALAFLGIWWTLRHDQRQILRASAEQQARGIYRRNRELLRDGFDDFDVVDWMLEVAVLSRSLDRLGRKHRAQRVLMDIGRQAVSSSWQGRKRKDGDGYVQWALQTLNVVLFQWIYDPEQAFRRLPEVHDHYVSELQKAMPDRDRGASVDDFGQ